MRQKSNQSVFFEPLTGPSQGVEEESEVQFLWQKEEFGKTELQTVDFKRVDSLLPLRRIDD